MVGLDYNYIDETGAKTSLDDVASNYELSKSQKEYLTELNVSPEEFKEMSDGQKEDLCHDIRDRLEEIEVYSVMAQDKAIKDTCCSEILGEFIYELSLVVPNIKLVYCVGNHGRVSANVKESINAIIM